MDEIRQLVKQTLNFLKNENINPTPKNFETQFYKQCKESNIKIDEYLEFEKLKNSLDENELFLEDELKSFYDLAFLINKRVKETQIKSFVDQLEFLLSPSIDYTIDNKLHDLIDELKKTPNDLIKNSTINRLRNFTTERITKDKTIVQEKAKDVKKVIALMGKYFDKCLLQSDDTSKEVSVIKTEIERLDLSKYSSRDISMLQGKLVDTIYKLENSIEESQKELFKGQTDCIYLQKQIDKLEHDLKEVSKEKDIDYLTGILNRRAFCNEVDKIENEYEIFNSKYAIAFYDIDHFKSINDNYGHDCGDTILATFAKILKKLTREEDIVCRYGGEEFVALIHYVEEEEVKNYIKRVKNIVSSNKFVYKDIKIKIKFSAGVSYRTKYPNYKEAMSNADTLLNKAKFEGRDKIVFDNGFVL